jgi:hypothetical protein
VGGFSKGEHSSSILTPYNFERSMRLVRRKIVARDIAKWWGSMLCDLLSKTRPRGHWTNEPAVSANKVTDGCN